MSKIQDSSIRHKRGSNNNHRPITTINARPRRRTPRPRGVFTTANKRRLLRFNSRGTLPRGIHTLTWEEFSKRFAYNPERQKLLRGLLRGIRILQRVGCHSIYIGGSFVTTKDCPSDVDVIWESSDMSFERVERVAPVFMEDEPGCPYQKHHFGAEFYPSECKEGISGLTFLEFFQRDFEQGRRRGIVRIDITYIPSSRPDRAVRRNGVTNRRMEVDRSSRELQKRL